MKYKNKKSPIKTVILDQSIIVGIGNIYADEILFLSKVNSLKKSSDLNNKELQSIIDNTKKVLAKAIELGGTTIRTYSAPGGIHGRFQQELLVHNQEGKPCTVCSSKIIKIKVNGRGTYYCPKCQK
jgi:formamidopyrimidine-DNA glycosylase